MVSIIFLILLINLVMIYKSENIPDLVKTNFVLTKSDFFRTYKYFPKMIDNLEHEIYVQIKTLNYNSHLKICSGYFLNAKDENIYFDDSKNDFVNCQKKYETNITDIKEFNINNSYYTSDITTNNGYFYITVYIDRINDADFSGIYMLFVTNYEFKVNLDEITNYFSFENNYKVKNFTFNAPFNKMVKGDLHVQIALNNKQNVFDLNITDENDGNIDYKHSIYSYNNIFVSKIEQNYYINLTFLRNDLKNQTFAIYFEKSTLNNNIMQISNDTIYNINFLTNCDYYFAQNIQSNIEDLYYIVNDFSDEKESVVLSYAKINTSNLSFNEISQINFNQSKHKVFQNLFTIFNCKIENMTDLVLIKVSGTGLPFLNMHKIQFKILPRIIRQEENDLGHYTFDSELIIERIGYFYIKKIENETKGQLIYCSKDKTMSIFKGDYNIIEDKSNNLISDDSRLYKITGEREIDETNYYTIITFNEKNKYFVQIVDAQNDICDNLIIDKVTDKTKNREIKINKGIKNYYLFSVNNYKSESHDIILDVQINHRNLSVEYIDIDNIDENKFNLSDIISFNEKVDTKVNARYPIIIKKTTEIIKITNNYYYDSTLFQPKFYLNKYLNIVENKIYNSLTPIFLKPLESKEFALDNNIIGNTSYLFKLGSYYKDYVKSPNETIIEIILGKKYFNNIYNISLGKNFIENTSYIYNDDTIKFINYIDNPILIWCYLGIKKTPKENINQLYLSNSYYYKKILYYEQKITFDWHNVKNKIKLGLIPQKLNILIINERQTKAKGYYYEKFNFEIDQDDDYLLYYSHLNSILYELEKDQSHIFLSEDININFYDDYYSDKGKNINIMIFPESGVTSAICYIDYLYNISNNQNELKYIYSDQSIYSLNLKLNISSYYGKNYSPNDDKSYLVFQFLFSEKIKDSNILFKIVNNTFFFDKEYNNIIINEISPLNIYGFFCLDNLDINKSYEDLYINILKPCPNYFKYYLTKNIKNDTMEISNNYNINIEKLKNSGGKIELSFDSFLKNINTNYSILIINKDEMKYNISNEFAYINFLETEKNNGNYKQIFFIDNNENEKIKKELSFERNGSYEIIIMAQSLISLSIYKYLGSKEFIYKEEIIDKESKMSKTTIIIIIIVIFSFVIVAIIIAFIIIHKKKKQRAINSINRNNEKVELNKKQNEIDKSNELSILSTNYDKSTNLLEDKPKEEENEQEKPPAPILGNTFSSEEDKINYEMSKLNEPSFNSNDNDEDKKYVNTNMGNNP